MRKLDHKQVLQLCAEHIFQQNSLSLDAIRKKQNRHKKTYPINALRGEHLFFAVERYEQYVKNGGAESEATQLMVEFLMKEEKVTSNFVAEYIAQWLKDTYTKHDWEVLPSIKKEVDEKLKRMREAKPNLPPQLYHEKSELGMIYRNTVLSPSICFGPTLPRDKYQEYFQFLFGNESKSFVNCFGYY